MKAKRWIGMVLMLMILMLGGTACMKEKPSDQTANTPISSAQKGTARTEDVQKAVLNFLSDKYGESFQLLQLSDEFDGKDGELYRAVCQSERYTEPFVLLAFRNLSLAEERVQIGETSFSVRDEYANLVFAHTYEGMLRDALPESVFVGSVLNTGERCFTKEEYGQGMAACLERDDVKAYVTSYVVLDPQADLAAAADALEQAMAGLSLRGQYFLLGTSAQTDESFWKQQFQEQYDNFETYFTRSAPLLNQDYLSVKGN